MSFVDPRNICQIEIQVRDLERAKSFYRHVFGWEDSFAEILNYCVFRVPDDCPFGLSLIKTTQASQRGVTVYFKIQDIDGIQERTQQAGGRVSFGPKPFPPYGTVIHIVDPDGNNFGLISPKTL